MLTVDELESLEASEQAVAERRTVCANCLFCPDPTEMVPDQKHRPEDSSLEYMCTRRPDYIFETRSGAHCNFWQPRKSSPDSLENEV